MIEGKIGYFIHYLTGLNNLPELDRHVTGHPQQRRAKTAPNAICTWVKFTPVTKARP